MSKGKQKNRKYSTEIKSMAVEDYLNNRGSQREISKNMGFGTAAPIFFYL